MAQVAERHEGMTSAFDTLRRQPAFGSDATRRAREQAFARFLDRGFPTTRDEEWRFTNVAPIAQTAFSVADVPVDAAAIAPLLFPGIATIVLVNGRLSRTLSALHALPAGVTITPGEPVDLPAVEGGAFVDLNQAFAAEAVTIDVAAATLASAPIHVLSMATAAAQATLLSPRLVIRVGEAAECSVVEQYASAGAGVTLTNVVTSIALAPGAILDHVKIQDEAATAFHVAALHVTLARASVFASRSLTFGGRIVRNDIFALLDGDGAECTLNGLYVAGGHTLVDNHTTIDHAQPNCPSHEVYKGILSGHARAVFNGKIIVRQDAQKTNAKQTNKALLLSDEAQINTKPQLEIFADDVKCTHGAAIGQLDDDALFYLRARGIAERDARALLIHAFAGQVIDEIKDDAVRVAVQGRLDRALGIGHAGALGAGH